MKKRVFSILSILLALSFLISGCNLLAAEKDFQKGNMTITLTNEFVEQNYEGFTACYASVSGVAIFALEEEFSLLEGFEDYSLREYAELVIEGNNLSATVKESDGLIGFEHNFYNSQTEEDWHYCSYVFKTNDAFWLFQFAALEEDIDDLRPSFVEWAKSIRFS